MPAHAQPQLCGAIASVPVEERAHGQAQLGASKRQVYDCPQRSQVGEQAELIWPVEAGQPGLILEVEQHREVLVRVTTPRPQKPFERKAHRALLKARPRVAALGLFPHPRVRIDAALHPLKQAKREAIRRDQSDPALVGTG